MGLAARVGRALLAAATLIATARPVAAATCAPSSADLCLLEGRFTARLAWDDGSGTKHAFVAAPKTDGPDSAAGLFFYYVEDASNWEILVKMIDGCGTNGHFWALVAGSTGFAWTLEITDEATGVVRTFTHPLDGQASGLEDFEAFATCGAADAAGFDTAPPVPESMTAPPPLPAPARGSAEAATSLAGYPCIASGFDLCLLEGRFRATLAWNDGSGPRPAYVAPPRTDGTSSASGLFYFYGGVPSNWESLVKVIDGCGTNDAFWVLVSAATGFGWDLTVTDELAGVTKTFSHPLDGHASGVADFSSFTTCAVPTPTPSPTPEPIVTPTPTPIPTPRPTPFAVISFSGGAYCGDVMFPGGYLSDPNHHIYPDVWSSWGPPLEVYEDTVGPFTATARYSTPCPAQHYDDVWPIEHGYFYTIYYSGNIAYGTDALTLVKGEPIYGDVASAFLGGRSDSLAE